MAEFPFESLSAALTEDQPCGPDLDMEGDAEYLNFSARIEGLLPASFFDFDRGSVDFPAETATIASISKKSIDLRVLVPFAKLLILNRDFRGFQQCMTAIAGVVEQRWEHVHPQPMDGDHFLRAISLQTLDDLPHTVFPLQSAPLFRTRRFGTVSFRQYLLAEGAIPPRKAHDDGGENEKVPSLADLRGAIADVEMTELVAARDIAAALLAAIRALETLYDTLAGQPGVLRFSRLMPGAEAILNFLEAGVVGRDPSLATLAAPAAGEDEDGEAQDAGGPVATGAIATLQEAAAALAAAAGYFARREPSSPSRLWLAQAQALIGSNFFEAVRSLVPDYASSASVRLGGGLPLTLSVERLSDLLQQFPAPEEQPEEEPPADASPSDGEGNGEAGDGGGDAPPPGPSGPKTFAAGTRQQALAMLLSIIDYFRINEPSSPIPLLLEQARSGSGRDFIALLRDVLPPRALGLDD